MSVRNLDKLFRARSVALIGASTRTQSVGDVLMRNLLSGGFAGPILPVHPEATSIQSTLAYRSIAELPLAPDLAVIATPAPSVPGLIAELGARGTRAAIVISAGFAEGGAAGEALQQQLLDAARPHLLRVIGPNCLGVLVPGLGLNASFAHLAPKPGPIALLAQSGAVITSILDWAASRDIGFSQIVSLGAMADIDFGDLLDYLAADSATSAVLLYVEAVTHARKFMSAARAVSRVKPVIVVKAGRHAAAAKAARSHTGALAGSDDVYRAAFRRAGMVRVLTLEELFDAAETLSRLPRISGDRLAIVTNGGGIGVLATDRLLDEGASLASLAPETIGKLNSALPPTWSGANPVDIIGDAGAERYEKAVAAVLADRNVDCLLVLNCPVAVADGLAAARAVAGAAKETSMPLLTSWLGEATAGAARNFFAEQGIPTYDTPGQAVRAFMHLVRHRRNQELLMEVPDAMPQATVAGRRTARDIVLGVRAEGRLWLTEPEAKHLLKAYGIPVVETEIAPSAEEAARRASEIGFPVALKILSPDITHKTDVGGVILGLQSAEAVSVAAVKMLEHVRRAAPAARLEGFSVQKMAHRPGAHELILGIARDPVFGPVILFGQGGVAVEVVRDREIGLPPLNTVLARDLISRTRIASLLAGYRDRAAADLDEIVRVLMALSEIAGDLPDIAELDINPLWADQSGVLALDARIRLTEGPQSTEGFAILPYPRELERRLEDRQGMSYRLRPIRPEDAPLLEAMIAASDAEDIRLRFFTGLRKLPKSLAARLTQIDYSREMAFVALGTDGRLAGAVHLMADPDLECADYGVFVRSDLKGRGLGHLLMSEMISYARLRGIKEIRGEVLAENRRMLELDSALGFTIHELPEEPAILEVRLRLV